MIIGTVPYLNGLPLTYYIPQTEHVIPLTPAELGPALLSGKIDVALMPVYSILRHNLHMHPAAGVIACDGAVRSVGLFTRPLIKNISDIKSLYLDQESRTSVHLAKILLKKYYNKSLYDLEFFHHDNRDLADAQVLIGDKALFYDHESTFNQFWDMGDLWKEHTGTGFMFACWASKDKLSASDINTLTQAKEMGLANLDEIVETLPHAQQYIVTDYYKYNMVYDPTPSIKEGLKLYKKHLKEYHYTDPTPKAVSLKSVRSLDTNKRADTQVRPYNQL